MVYTIIHQRTSWGSHEGDAHSRHGGTNKPHHKEHRKHKRLYHECVDYQTVAPHVNRVDAK
jgi:hypothetical protein